MKISIMNIVTSMRNKKKFIIEFESIFNSAETFQQEQLRFIQIGELFKKRF